MADYISREAAIQTLRNLTFDLGDQTDIDDIIDDVLEFAISAVERLVPAADVRPVVLCRDCKHFNPYPGDCTDGGIEGVCKRHNSIGVLVMDEDFCSDAERI